MDCSLLGSSVHGMLQARRLEWVAISFSTLSIKSKSLLKTRLWRWADGFRISSGCHGFKREHGCPWKSLPSGSALTERAKPLLWPGWRPRLTLLAWVTQDAQWRQVSPVRIDRRVIGGEFQPVCLHVETICQLIGSFNYNLSDCFNLYLFWNFCKLKKYKEKFKLFIEI